MPRPLTDDQLDESQGSFVFRRGKSFRATILREEWYRQGVFSWTNDRVSKLCHRTNLTIWDLAATIALFDENGDIDRNLVHKLWKSNYWPPYIGILLTNLERDANDRSKGSGEIRNDERTA